MGVQRSAKPLQLFFERSLPEAVVSIEQHPDEIHVLFRNRDRNEGYSFEDELDKRASPICPSPSWNTTASAKPLGTRTLFGPNYEIELAPLLMPSQHPRQHPRQIMKLNVAFPHRLSG